MINMKGYRVAYGNHVYDCLYAEPIWGPPTEKRDDDLVYPEELQLWVIDHSAMLAVITDAHYKFKFFKEDKT